MKARLMVVDDHPVFRYGLVSLVESEPQFEVIAQAGSYREALETLRGTTPDFLVVDLSLGPDGSGLELLETVRKSHPQVLCLVVSIHNEAVYSERARAAGARGYVMKQAPGTVLKDAIRSILAGRTVFPASTPEVGEVCFGPAVPRRTLSPREQEVLELLGRGRGVNEIAASLRVSAKTIGVHQEHIKTRLGIANNYELRRYAIEWLASQ